MPILHKIRIQNFKNLEDVTIDVKSINLLFGSNAAGKSSLMQAMMFLWKNISPINTNETIYKINKSTDLISYHDIVTNNEAERDIIFELYLTGEFNFPKFDILRKEFRKGFLNELYENKLSDEISYYFPIIEQKGIFSFMEACDKYSVEFGGYYPEGYEQLFETKCFNYKIKVVFKNSGYDDNCNLFQIVYVDLKNKSELTLENEEASETIVPRDFIFMKNDEATDRFSQFIRPETTLGYISSIPSFADVKDSHIFEIGDVHLNTLYENWGKLSDGVKMKYYYEFLIFYHLTHSYFNKILNGYSHNLSISSVREIPSPIYIMDYKRFNQEDYYGILDFCDSDENIRQLNSWLRKFDFEGDLVLIKESLSGGLKIISGKKEYFLSNASSGLIQLLPIIVGCIKLKNVIDKRSFESKNSIYNPLYKLFPKFTSISNFLLNSLSYTYTHVCNLNALNCLAR